MAASETWLGRVERGARPLYLALTEALAAAVRDGELQPGDQLPTQRAVAQRLGIDFTTVTRAYGVARNRGLIEGAVGRGTFVRARPQDDDVGRVDLSMNLPPPPQGVSLAGLLRDTTKAILDRTDAATLMAYHPGAGTLGQKAAAANWLAPMLGDSPVERILICPGAQAGLAAVLSAVARPGDAVLAEPLAYPGLRAATEQLGLRLIACPADADGVEPEALARLAATERPAALYLTPTTHNPTALTMGLARRRAVADILRAGDTWLIEDDPYARLFDTPAPAIASLIPDRAFHLSTLSKCLSPGLRIAFLRTPGGAMAERAAQALRAMALTPAPLMAAVVATWIRDGSAETLLAGVRREARARRAIAAEVLPDATGAAEGVHVWLDLPDAWAPDRLDAAAQARGLSLVTAGAFATAGAHRNGVRISLGGPAKQSVLRGALEAVAALVAGAPGGGRVVV